MKVAARSAFCRDCLAPAEPLPSEAPCDRCGSPRVIRHPELFTLSLAHLDCDAFYAAVEKRDNAELANKPLIIGGAGPRGVVSTACYMARMFGVRSAMPMFKARRLCPEAVILPPDMAKYTEVGHAVRALMLELTPLVEPLSLDEAFLDLAGTERLHGHAPAESLALLVRRIEKDIGITASIGLSYNKFLAKLASDIDKPRGFAIVGRAEAVDFLAPRPVGDIWGVGKALNRKLLADGITTIGQFKDREERQLVARYGSIGRRLWHFARGEDDRRVDPAAPAKSVSAETTFDTDIADREQLEAVLWRLSEKVSQRLKRQDAAGRTLTLKLKTAAFDLRTRSRQLSAPTQLAEAIYRGGSALLADEADGTAFRLLGIGLSSLGAAVDADPLDLGDPEATHRAQVEHAIDSVRTKFGAAAIAKGRALKGNTRRH